MSTYSPKSKQQEPLDYVLSPEPFCNADLRGTDPQCN